MEKNDINRWNFHQEIVQSVIYFLWFSDSQNFSWIAKLRNIKENSERFNYNNNKSYV